MMKPIITAIICLAALFTGCKQNTTEISEPAKQVKVKFTVFAAERQTRTDENSIHDLNIYMVDEPSQVCFHFYTRTTAVQFSCPAGKYKLHVVANAHGDLGDMTAHQVQSFNVEYQSSPQDLVMTAVRDLTLEPSKNPVEIRAIEVQRFSARINYQIRVESQRPIEIRSVQLMHAPRSAMPFSTSMPTAFIDAPIHENTGHAETFSGSYYMLANCQGTVSGIVNQKQKNPENAPVDATFLRIRAVCEAKVLDYMVYLGENNTDNFDIRANTAHTLDIIIRSDDELDVRIRSYTVNAESRIEATPQDNIYLTTAPITLSILLSGDYEDMGVHAKMELKAGNLKFFIFNTKNVSSQIIPHLTGMNSFPIRYRPDQFSSENIRLEYTVSIYDRYGWVTDFDFSYTFAHVWKVYVKWFDGGNYGGTITSEDAVAVILKTTLSAAYYNIYCAAEGCTLQAIPDPGRTFDGWWRQHNHTGLISTSATHKFGPDENEIYVHFR